MARSASTKNAKSALPTKQNSPSRKNMLVWWGGLGCGGILVLSPGSAILLVSLLSPVVLVAFLPEEGGAGRVVRAALLFGLAASVSPLRMFWQNGGATPDALAMVHRPAILLVAWTAIAVGWLICECAGMGLRLAADYSAASRGRGLSRSIAKLEDEWGTLDIPPESSGMSGRL